MIQVSIESIQDALYKWVNSVLPTTPIIWYHENAPRPNVPYIALHLSMIDTVKQDYVDGAGNLTGNRDFILLVQGIGKNSMDFCEELKTSLSLPAIRAALRQDGIVFVNRLAITCISEVVDSRWEERNLLDLKFRFAQIDTDNSGTIDHFGIKGDVLDVDLSTVTEINIAI
jgi:hypothetical protein